MILSFGASLTLFEGITVGCHFRSERGGDSDDDAMPIFHQLQHMKGKGLLNRHCLSFRSFNHKVTLSSKGATY